MVGVLFELEVIPEGFSSAGLCCAPDGGLEAIPIGRFECFKRRCPVHEEVYTRRDNVKRRDG
jgi:hypothetical protein